MTFYGRYKIYVDLLTLREEKLFAEEMFAEEIFATLFL